MNCCPPTPVTEIINGPVGPTGATGPQGPAVTVGTMAAQNATDVGILGGYISGISIMETSVLILDPETGYPTGGNVQLRFDVKSLIYIGLTVDVVLSTTAENAGRVMVLILKNTTAGNLNISWPAWTPAGGSFPPILTSGQSMIVHAYCIGNSTSNVYAISSL